MFFSLIIALLMTFNPGNALKKQIHDFLKKNLVDYKQFEFQIVQMPENYIKVIIEKSDDFKISGNLAYIPVRVVSSADRQTRSFITIRLKLYKEVLVAVKNLKPKEDLSKDEFQFKNVDVTQVRGTPVLSFDKITSFRSKINIKKGDVLIKECIEEKPIINPGDVVTASYSTGNVTVSTQAISKQEGCKGQVITILTRDKRYFKAKVLDSQHVNIIE